MFVQVSLESCLKPTSLEPLDKFPLSEQANIATLIKALGLREDQVMAVFIDGLPGIYKTKLHDGAKVNLCAFISGG